MYIVMAAKIGDKYRANASPRIPQPIAHSRRSWIPPGKREAVTMSRLMDIVSRLTKAAKAGRFRRARAASHTLRPQPSVLRHLLPLLLLAAWGGLAADAPAATPPASATAPTQTVGKLTLNGAKYEGEIHNGQANGKGKLTLDDGRRYVGEFKDNQRHGQGTWTVEGFKYTGGWQNDSYHGQGTETYPRGRKYVGEFKDGFRNGQGIMTLPDGRKFEGEWQRNNYVGPVGTKPAEGGSTGLPSAVPKPGSAHPGAASTVRGVSDPSLVVWYKFDEGARDSSGNGLHGGIEGTVPWEPGCIGSGAAACREGYIRLPDLSGRFTTEATLSVWIKMDSAAPLGQSIFNFGEGGADHYPWTDGKIYVDALRNGGVSFPAPATVDRTKWHHLAVTHKPGPDTWKCYINGTLAGCFAGQDAITLPAGSNLGNGGYGYAAAAFDDFRLYSRALSSNEVQALYGQGLEPTAQAATPPPVGSDAAVLVNEDTVWRHLHLEGPSYFLLDDPAPEVNFGGTPEIVQTALGPMAKVGTSHGFSQAGVRVWRPEATSPAPSPDWAGPTFDDSLWLRASWPQPVPDLSRGVVEKEAASFLKKANPFDTVVVLARSRFEIKDPQRVKTCRFSLDYWGGVVVYVNGKEAARGHLPGQETNLLARLAEPYPEKVLPFKSPFAAAGCLRQLREVEIPASLLRPGVNVLAVEAHPAPILYSTWKRYDEYYAWPAIGVARAQLTVAPVSAAVTNGLRRQGVQVWNCAASDTLTFGNDLRETGPVQPVLIRAARNSVFSGRLVVGSDQTIKGLTVSVGDLVKVAAGVEPGSPKVASAGAAKIPAAAVRVRCAVPATPGKSWVPAVRFDGLLDQIPAEIPAYVASTATKALAPLWFTMRVPATVPAGRYEGRITIAAQGFPPQSVPLHVQVCDWAMPDVQDWRMQNFIYHAEELEAKYYGVTNYSARHLELVGKTLAALAELNSRQVMANLVCDFFACGYGGGSSNPESLVRWVKQPDGTFKHDFTNFDRYLDMVAKTIGKPRTLRLNCWGEYNPKRTNTTWIDPGFDNTGERPVTVFDPATGQLSRMKQPPLGTEENYRFWKPVFDEVRKKIKARGWLDETTLGYSAWFASSFPALVDVANRLWPGAEWSFTGHNGSQDMLFRGSDTNLAMIVRHSDTVYVSPRMGVQTAPKEVKIGWAEEAQSKIYMRAEDRQPLWLLDGPRRNTFTFGCRMYQRDDFPLSDMRLLAENYVLLNGFDGLGDFGANLFPMKKPAGGYYIPAAGAGTGWAGDYRSTLALLYPGPDGPVATERFEALREGLELCEAVMFVKNALAKQRTLLSSDLQQRAERYLSERDFHYPRLDFHVRYLQAAEDARLLDLAGELAKELAKKK
jgi:hypothetical protein